MSACDYKLLIDSSEKFSNIEMIAIRLDKYIPIGMPSSGGFGNLTAEIIVNALRAFNEDSGEIAAKYQTFLFEIIKGLKSVLMFGVSNADKKNVHSRGLYWDCFHESYYEWSNKNSVHDPMIEKTAVELGFQSRVVGLVMASFVLSRSDWSFIGIPHPGVNSVAGSNELDKLLTDKLIA